MNDDQNNTNLGNNRSNAPVLSIPESNTSSNN